MGLLREREREREKFEHLVKFPMLTTVCLNVVVFSEGLFLKVNIYKGTSLHNHLFCRFHPHQQGTV